MSLPSRRLLFFLRLSLFLRPTLSDVDEGSYKQDQRLNEPNFRATSKLSIFLLSILGALCCTCLRFRLTACLYIHRLHQPYALGSSSSTPPADKKVNEVCPCWSIFEPPRRRPRSSDLGSDKSSMGANIRNSHIRTRVDRKTFCFSYRTTTCPGSFSSDAFCLCAESDVFFFSIKRLVLLYFWQNTPGEGWRSKGMSLINETNEWSILTWRREVAVLFLASGYIIIRKLSPDRKYRRASSADKEYMAVQKTSYCGLSGVIFCCVRSEWLIRRPRPGMPAVTNCCHWSSYAGWWWYVDLSLNTCGEAVEWESHT